MRRVRIHFDGRLGKDPEMRTSQTGKDYLRFPVAVEVEQRSKDEEQAGPWWVSVMVFDEHQQHYSQYLRKGDAVSVMGQLTRSTTDEGFEFWNLLCSSVMVLKSRSRSPVGDVRTRAARSKPDARADRRDEDLVPEDAPF